MKRFALMLLGSLGTVLLLSACSAGSDSSPASNVSSRLAENTTAAAAVNVDPLVGSWVRTGSSCQTGAVTLTASRVGQAVYLLKGAGLSCFLDATPIGIAGDLDFPARCRTTGRGRAIEAVSFNVNEPDRLEARYRGTRSEVLRRCATAGGK